MSATVSFAVAEQFGIISKDKGIIAGFAVKIIPLLAGYYECIVPATAEEYFKVVKEQFSELVLVQEILIPDVISFKGSIQFKGGVRICSSQPVYSIFRIAANQSTDIVESLAYASFCSIKAAFRGRSDKGYISAGLIITKVNCVLASPAVNLTA